MILSELQAGESATILRYTEKNAYRKKLLALGVLPGTVFTIIRVAPLGDPIEIKIRGYNLILRKHETDVIEIVYTCNM